jgi:glycosyltransferase involved in cell wall biosynthesis
MKKRILLVTADATQTGVPRQIAILAPRLCHYYEVHLACPQGWLSDTLSNTAVIVHLCNNSQELLTISKAISPDLASVHTPRAALWVGSLLRKLPCPWTYTEHLWTENYRLPNPIRHYIQINALVRIIRKAAAISAVSRSVQQFLQIKTDLPIMLTHNALSIMGTITENQVKKNPRADSLKILFIGSLNLTKGADMLIPIFKNVIAAKPKASLTICGTGKLLAAIKKQISQLPDDLQSAISLIPNDLNDQSLTELYHTHDYYIQPSRSESFGVAALEASYFGLPVIASNVGGLPEIIIDGRTGKIADPTIDSFSQALITVINDSNNYSVLSKAGQDHAKQFTVDQQTDKYLQLFYSVLTD